MNQHLQKGRVMRGKALILAALIVGVAAIAQSAPATDKAEVMAAVTQYIDSNNRNDEKAASAACTKGAVVIDSIAPYVWQGDAACADWWKDVDAYDTKNGITEPTVTPDKPWTVDV